MELLSMYVDFVLKYKHIFLLIIIPASIYFGPIGFNSYEYIESELGFGSLGTEEGVFTFTSFTDDVIILFDGDHDLISQEFQDWLSNFAFQLQNNPKVQAYAQDATTIEHIFSDSQQLLSQYYTSIYTAYGLGNVSLFTIVEGTNQFYNLWSNQSMNLSASDVNSLLLNNFTAQIIELDFGSLEISQTFAELWFDGIEEILAIEDKVTFSLDELFFQLNNSALQIVSDLPELLKPAIVDFVNHIDSQTLWNSEQIAPIISNYLFGVAGQGEIDFLIDLFDDGNDPTRPIKLAQDALIPYLRLEFMPIGFPVEIRDYYLSAFTNYDGTNVPDALLLRFRLRAELTDNQISDMFIELERIINEARIELGGDIEVGLLSYLNFTRERNELIGEEMHQVDLIAVIVGFLIMLVILRDPILSLLLISVAWGSTQVSRGILVKLLPFFGGVNSTSFSIATTLLLGASMNYTVFFKFRYLEERSKNNNHDDSILKTSNTALHSVLISGTALLLSMIPYRTSTQAILSELSLAIVAGIFLQTILIFHFLPVIFGSLGKLDHIFHNTNFDKIPTFAVGLDINKSKKIIILSLILVFISLIILATLSTSFATDDIIGDTGETGKAFQQFDESFPQEYLSKYLVAVEFNQDLYVDNQLNFELVSIIDELSNKIANKASIGGVLSIAWPLGTAFNFTDTSIGQIQYEVSNIVIEELINENRTYLIIQSTLSTYEREISDLTGEIINLLEEFSPGYNQILSTSISGLPIELYQLNEEVERELPIQIFYAIVLITIFLAANLKSIWVPLRLEFTIIMASIYSIALSSIILNVFFDMALNIIVLSSSFLVLLGLGTDFDIYLYRRIEEEYKNNKLSFKEAIFQGVNHSAPAIISSGLVMAFSFLALLNSQITIIQQFGLVIFVTIMIDILIVRTIIVPAILLVTMGDKND